jgi:predicted nucleic acid-binding protein
VTPPFLDTSVLVRYLTLDPPDMARRAGVLIDSSTPLSVSAVMLAEAAHVLRQVYRRSREEVVDALVRFVQGENIVLYGLDRQVVVEALLRCRPSGRVSVPDALIWAEARSSGANAVYTFDRPIGSFRARASSGASSRSRCRS